MNTNRENLQTQLNEVRLELELIHEEISKAKGRLKISQAGHDRLEDAHWDDLHYFQKELKKYQQLETQLLTQLQ